MRIIKNFMLPCRTQRGIGLLELMFSLVVILILLVMATRYYETARAGYRVHEALGMVHAVYTASESWLHNNETLPADARAEFIKNGTLPANFDKSVNPWGGTIGVTGTGINTILTITLSNIPLNECNNLKEKLIAKLSVVPPNGATCDGDKKNFSASLDFSRQQ